MKILAFVLIIGLLISCSKDRSGDPELPYCTEGTLKYLDPAMDGNGWKFQDKDTSTTFFILLERSIPLEFRVHGLKVSLCIQKQESKFSFITPPGDIPYYKVTSIRRR